MITSTSWTCTESHRTDEESDMIHKKGTKHGDPPTSMLSNTVLQKALEEDIGKGKEEWVYAWVSTIMTFTNMRFADVVLLFASSKEQLQKMLCDFKRSTEKVWLSIHPGKTKILSNQSSNIGKEIEIEDIIVEISTREESATYLG